MIVPSPPPPQAATQLPADSIAAKRASARTGCVGPTQPPAFLTNVATKGISGSPTLSKKRASSEARVGRTYGRLTRDHDCEVYQWWRTASFAGRRLLAV